MAEKETSKVLFSGKDVRVRRGGAVGGNSICVTFCSWQREPSYDNKGWGETFFERENIPAIYYLASRNHWWQTLEMLDALNATLPILQNYKRIIAYGSSMGGYGACLFSDALAANEVVALSPQYSIWPDKLPAEQRWASTAREVPPIFDNMPERISRTARISIFYDPEQATASLDYLHARAFAHLGAYLHALPKGGHSVAGLLHKYHLLAKLQLEMIRPNADIGKIAGEAVEAARREASQNSQ